MEAKEGQKLLQGGSPNEEVVKFGHEPRQGGSKACALNCLSDHEDGPQGVWSG